MLVTHLALAVGLAQVTVAAALPVTDTSIQNRADHFSEAGFATLSVQDIQSNNAAAKGYICPAGGVQIIAARGTHQDGTTGPTMGHLADAITKLLPKSKTVGVQYPASKTPTYDDSEGTGTNHITTYIEFFAKLCPETPLAIIGYSQGGQITMDALCGTTEGKGFAVTAPLAQQYRSHVQSVVVWGDPSHTLGEPFNMGTATRDGIFPRNISGCEPYVNKVVSYCDYNDPFCASGNDVAVHHTYDTKYRQVSAQFVANHFD